METVHLVDVEVARQLERDLARAESNLKRAEGLLREFVRIADEDSAGLQCASGNDLVLVLNDARAYLADREATGEGK
jgi:hypothetical protein